VEHVLHLLWVCCFVDAVSDFCLTRLNPHPEPKWTHAAQHWLCLTWTPNLPTHRCHILYK
jgi:hypothetical protein